MKESHAPQNDCGACVMQLRVSAMDASSEHRIIGLKMR